MNIKIEQRYTENYELINDPAKISLKKELEELQKKLMERRVATVSDDWGFGAGPTRGMYLVRLPISLYSDLIELDGFIGKADYYYNIRVGYAEIGSFQNLRLFLLDDKDV